MTVTLASTFPYFGGKRRVAPLVWQRFGTVVNYVEPFFGSGATLLQRPTPFIGSETVNDLNGWLTNFWRALRDDPDGVAEWTDYPVSELDLHARGDWLFYRPDVPDFIERLRAEPDWYDVKSAGWWVWGQCSWIGSGWGPIEHRESVHTKRPHLMSSKGVNRQLPHVGNAGRGERYEAIRAYFADLSDRLRGVRIACGDWTRVCGPSVTFRHGMTGVFLDPPYDQDERAADCYVGHETRCSAEVRAWAIEQGDNPLMRIALCGYEGEHAMPDTWECVAWKAAGGYGSQGDTTGRENCTRERIWFSPACARPQQAQLF